MKFIFALLLVIGCQNKNGEDSSSDSNSDSNSVDTDTGVDCSETQRTIWEECSNPSINVVYWNLKDPSCYDDSGELVACNFEALFVEINYQESDNEVVDETKKIHHFNDNLVWVLCNHGDKARLVYRVCY